MCYLRNFTPIQRTFTPKEQLSIEQSLNFQTTTTTSQKFNVDFSFLQNQKSSPKFVVDTGMFMNLLKLAQKNSQTLQNLSIKIEQNDSLLNQIQDNEDDVIVTKTVQENQIDTEQSSIDQENSFKTQQFLTQKLFGENNHYKFKLILDGEFPEQIFKERNFSFNLKLTDINGNPIRNSNIIHLCLGVCDVNGEWITETKAKQNLIKGKTQSELYHGQASYSKIYSRDVSRHYSDGKLNIVIYPKQSVLKYSQGTSFLQEHVNSQYIEPLIIKDLIIKAKKKQ